MELATQGLVGKLKELSGQLKILRDNSARELEKYEKEVKGLNEFRRQLVQLSEKLQEKIDETNRIIADIETANKELIKKLDRVSTGTV